ncbi:Universal stress protein A [Marinomonas aquimarina]|uniref:Universal stress protein n=1 Tax=Marinomonas aquimarina TaxID=295068 RepID=A0A1A8TLD1_9GAMM|nr:universal stress protein [Marinomonas aquimarina]SBS34684.1 Universal stress protein A [Marinomonas aquimarina]
MSYGHILVAVDLSEDSMQLINKAIAQATPDLSKLSIVYVDKDHVLETAAETQSIKDRLQTLADDSGYPITDITARIGDLHIQVANIVAEEDVDLVVCGHHHDFLSRITSSVASLVNSVKTDLLVVYLDD